MTEEVKTNNGMMIILDQHKLHELFDFMEMYKHQGGVKKAIGIGGEMAGGFIRTNLVWDEKTEQFEGKIQVTHKNLAGVKNINIPTITMIPKEKIIMFTMKFGNMMFTQRTYPDHYSFYKQLGGASRHMIDVLQRRLAMTINMLNGFPNMKYELMGLEFVEELLRENRIVKTFPARKEIWEVVPTVVKEEMKSIDEVKYDGLLVKHSIVYYNGGKQKEEIEYYIIEALGEVRTYRGSNPDFMLHDRIGYVAMVPKVAPVK